MSKPTAKPTDPLVVAVANYKGGVGKSTIAEHAAAYRRAAVVDLDRNADSARFGDQYGLEVHRMATADPGHLFDLVERLREEGKDVVIDCPPGESPLTRIALLCADVVVCPTRPGPHDLYALGRVTTATREAARERGAVPLLFVCNFYRNSDMAKVFVGTLQASADGQYVGKLWERKEYAESVMDGKPVWEAAPNSTGAKEMGNLVDFLFKAAHQAAHQAAAEAVNG